MKNLIKADIYRVLKSRLSLIALILALAFPVLIVFLYVGITMISGVMQDYPGGTLFSANTIIGSAFSMTNNIGMVIPAFAGILACLDYTNGTLRNKVIAGNRRAHIYFSHLIVSVLFSVIIITVYAAVTTGLSLIFFPFEWNNSTSLGLEIFYFVMNGIMTFTFAASFSTMLAMITRSIAPTIVFTIVFSIALPTITSIVSMVDYESFKYAAYFIPTFGSNFFNLNGTDIFTLFNQTTDASRGLIFAESMLSFLFFSAVNTLIGLSVFRKRDLT
ncbi:MAG: ABC transporter permease subunit [Lachnospiraceae bacterium]|nr:ABC transporter permease subunit [Lachnospiraceae bacterium]